jgi:hypothetical protein
MEKPAALLSFSNVNTCRKKVNDYKDLKNSMKCYGLKNDYRHCDYKKLNLESNLGHPHAVNKHYQQTYHGKHGCLILQDVQSNHEECGKHTCVLQTVEGWHLIFWPRSQRRSSAML